MKGRRFIAGAVCPACGAMDRIVLVGDGRERHCVDCGHVDGLPVAASREVRTRVSGGSRKADAQRESPRPVRIVGPTATRAPEEPPQTD